MGPALATKPGPGVRDMPPNIFAIVMATGIVSLARRPRFVFSLKTDLSFLAHAVEDLLAKPKNAASGTRVPLVVELQGRHQPISLQNRR